MDMGCHGTRVHSCTGATLYHRGGRIVVYVRSVERVSSPLFFPAKIEGQLGGPSSDLYGCVLTDER